MAENNTKRNKDYGSKKGQYVKLPEVYSGIIEYKMSKTLADNILKGKTNSDPQTLLCDYVNTQLGLKGYCVKVHVEVE